MVYTLPHILAEVKSKTLGHKRTDEKGEEVVNALGDTLAGVEAKTHGNTRGDK